jgi:uncharacterized membrane protein YbhN (UPF0104 family)
MRFRYPSVSPYLTGALRLVAVPAGLVWAFTHAPAFVLSNTITVSPLWMVLALAAYQIALLIFAARMRFLLKLWNIRIGWIAAIRIHFQSLFYFVAVPMTVGMEISRFIKIRAIDPSASKVGLAAALLVDRCIGALAALCVVLLCLPVLKFGTALPIAPRWLWAGVAAGLGLAVSALAWPASRRKMSEIWDVTKGRRKGVLAAFVLGVLMNLATGFAVEFAAISLGVKISLLDALFSVSGGMLLIALPVSFAGLGPADAGAAGLLMILGHDLRSSIMVGVLPYAGRLVAAVQGGLWEFFDGGKAAFLALSRSGKRSNVTAPAPMGK